MSAKLNDIVDAIEMHFPETTSFVNKVTGEVVTMSQDVLETVDGNELDKLLSECPEWQREEYTAARDFLDHEENFVPLPDEFDVDEYSMMENFCGTVADEKMTDALYRAIHGKGAFRRFKDEIHRFGVQQQWYDYRHAELVRIAKEWCQANGIEFTDG
jgi:hypothetical protein